MKKTILLMLIAASFISVSKGNISFDKQKKMEEEIVLQTKEKEQEKPVKNIASVTQNKSMGATEKKYRDYIIKVAKSKIGTPYVWGGENNSGFDCSGLVQYSYRKAGINTPRVANDMANTYERIYRAKDLKPGDLIFFETKEAGRISHTGMYIGNGYFIHASSAYKQVTISKLEGFYAEHFKGGANILKQYL